MERDFELTRDLLEWINTFRGGVQAYPPGARVDAPVSLADDVRLWHLVLLIESTLVVGRVLHNQKDQLFGVLVERLTWQGHEMLAVLRARAQAIPPESDQAMDAELEVDEPEEGDPIDGLTFGIGDAHEDISDLIAGLREELEGIYYIENEVESEENDIDFSAAYRRGYARQWYASTGFYPVFDDVSVIFDDAETSGERASSPF